jgi:hypothetical protein
MRYRFFSSHKFHVLSSKMSLYAFSFSVVDLVMRSENWNDAWIVIALVLCFVGVFLLVSFLFITVD